MSGDLNTQTLDKIRALYLKALKEGFRKRTFQKLRHIPSTGMGCFDANYNPVTGNLDISVKVFYEWDDKFQKFSKDDQANFKKKAKRVVESNWSKRYTIRCTKEGWTDVVANPIIHWVEVPTAEQAYFKVHVWKDSKDKARGGGIETSDFPMVLTCYTFAVEETQQRGDEVFNYYEKLAVDGLNSCNASFIEFDGGSDRISGQSQQALRKYAAFINTALRHDYSGIQMYVYGSKSADRGTFLASKRAKAVKNLMNQTLVNQGFVHTISNLRKHSRAKVGIESVLEKKIGRRTTDFDGAAVLVHVPKGTKREVKTNYIIMAHEFGHCLGLPDEYKAIQCTDLKDEVDLRQIVADTTLTAQVAGDADDRIKVQQEAFANALRSANLPAPLFMAMNQAANAEAFQHYGVATQDWNRRRDEILRSHARNSPEDLRFKEMNPQPEAPAMLKMATPSIMYSGREVYPAHYLTIWSCLRQMTAGFIGPSEWEISSVQNSPAERILFAR